MKKLFFFVFAMSSIVVRAQQNVLLEQSFWKTSPDVNTLKSAIEKGNDPAQFNAATFDPTVLAINANAPVETIKYLLTLPGNEVNKITHDSRNYFHWAASRGNIEILEFLISKGAQTNNIDSHGSTPLNFAAGAGQQNTKVYDLCIAHGANLKTDLNHDGANALLIAIPNDKNLTLTNYFVSKGLSLKSLDAAGNNAFAYAARSGNIELLKSLLEKGVPATDQAMLMAAQGSRGGANPIEVYQYLESLNLKPGVVGKTGENVLHSLARKPKQADIIQHFISKGVDVNKADEDGNTPIMNAAASNRDTAVFNVLISKVKDINQGNLKGVTPIAMAVRSNSPEIVAYLTSKNASVFVNDGSGNNLIFYLIQSYNEQRQPDFDAKLAILTGKGLKIDMPQKNGNTLYHLAVAKNSLPLLKHLQGYQVDINAKNSEGLTALHRAAMISKDDAMLKYLISLGARKDIPTSFEETAFDLAQENESLSKNHVTVNFLK